MRSTNTLIIKYYALIIAMLLLFIFIGSAAYQYLISNIFPEQEVMPPLFIAKMIDVLGKQDKIAGIKYYLNLKSGLLGPDLELFDEHGNTLYSNNTKSEIASMNNLKTMLKPYDYVQLGQPKEQEYNFISQHFLKFYPRRPVFLVRLAGKPASYIKIIPSHYAEEKNQSILFFIFSLITLMISLLLGVAISIYLIYLSITKHTTIANHVISELQKGNLKARFPIHRMDEFGRAMLKFNQMADELEQHILAAKQAEKVRINLLQELTHDLKTPISSLKMLLETLETKDRDLDEKLKKELLSLSRKEVDYFAKLIDDLLLLARMSEPKYQIQHKKINLSQLLTETIHDTDCRESQINNKKIIKKFSDENKFIYGDEHLLKRAFRNALENATYHSNQSVSVDIKEAQHFTVIIQDDGCGFSQETKQTFGERLISRKVTDETGATKVSIGLGSVIIKTICELHSAKLHLNNAVNDAYHIIGARLEIELPRL